MIDETAQRIHAVVLRFSTFEIETSDPKWSSSVLDIFFKDVLAAPGGCLQDVYQGLDTALKNWSVQLTTPVGHLIKDVVVQGFTMHPSSYNSIRWDWANDELSYETSAARCYLFLLAVPPDFARPESILAIYKGLQGTPYEREASATLSDDLERPEIKKLLTPA